MTQRRDMAWWLPLGVLLAALIFLFYRILLGEVLFWGLPSLQFYPWRWLSFSQLRNGDIPFWNPYNGGGTPLLANYQSAVLYPPNWLYFLIPRPQTMGFIALLHVLLAGIGMWNLTGKLELSSFGRGVSLLCFALGSYLLGRLGSFPTANAVTWIPWLFWACLRLMENRRRLDVGLLGLFTGLQLLSGHAQTSWYAFVALGLFALWYVLWPLRGAGRGVQVQALILAGIGLALGVGIASWQMVMTLEFLQQSQRAGGVSYDELTNLSYAPLRILTMLAPHFFGTPADGSYLTPGKGIYYEDAAYIGFLPLISAIFAITGWLKWRKFLRHHMAFRSVPFWILLSIAGFLLALGKYSPFFHSLYAYVPTFDNFREPVRWLLWPAFGLSILAGIGVHNWSQSQRAFFWTRLSLAGGVGMIVVTLISLVSFRNLDQDVLQVLAKAIIATSCWLIGAAVLTLKQPAPSLTGQAVRWQAAVLIFVAADLAWAVVGLNPTISDNFYQRDFSLSRPQGRLYWFEDYEEDIKFERYFDLSDYRLAKDRWTDVRTSLLPNLNILDRIDLFNSFDPLQPAAHRQYVELIEDMDEDSSALLRAAGVGQVYGPVLPKGWLQGQNEFTAEAPTAPSDVWMVPEAIWLEDDTDVIEQLRSATWNPEQTVILQRGEIPTSDLRPYTQAEVEVLSERPNNREYRIISDGPGFLVLANTWYPGWKVTVDGETVPLYKANLAFQAVFIPEGGGDVTFSYTPRGTGITFPISILSIFISVGLIAWGLFREPTIQSTTL